MRFFALLVLLTPSLAWASCPAEKAHYVARGESQITAGFRPLPRRTDFVSDLAFYISNRATGHTLWFGFDTGAASRVSLISTTDITAKGWRQAKDGSPPDAVGPLGDLQYLSSGPDMAFGLDVPLRGKPAPTFIVLPEMGEAMWQSRFRGEANAIGAYVLTGCDK